jgi:hypothetical protein
LPLIKPEDEVSERQIEMALIDIASGEVAMAYEAGCGIGIDVSERAGRLAYGVCRSDGEHDARTQVRFHDLNEARDIAAVDLEGRGWQMRLSPGGDWVTVTYAAEKSGTYAPVAVHVSGAIHTFEAGWSPLGWSGRNDVILSRYSKAFGIDALAVADVRTGEMRQVFP